MHGVFDWAENRHFAQVPSGRIIEPHDSYTWNLSHGYHAMTIYPLCVGTHTVIGEVVGYGQAAPVEFKVVPEPATIILFGLGGLVFTQKRKMKTFRGIARRVIMGGRRGAAEAAPKS